MGIPVLSICIPVHNRWQDVKVTIDKLLKLDNFEFDIVVSDSSIPEFKTHETNCYEDSRINIYQVSDSLLPMENWKNALDKGDGLFIMHLNDRDTIYPEELLNFIKFLKKNTFLNGGVCLNSGKTRIFKNVKDGIMNVPYYSYHPTGIFFKNSEYKKITRHDFFTKKYGIHPHDIILGHLAAKGSVALYGGKIWSMPPYEYLKNNVSGFEKKTDLFFEPEQRKLEYDAMIIDLFSLNISNSIKKHKKLKILITYIELATINYFYYIETPELASHYAIEPTKMSFQKKYILLRKIINSTFKNEISVYWINIYIKFRFLIRLAYLEVKKMIRSKVYGHIIRNERSS